VQVATFDELGVSGHPNHIAVHYGVKKWFASTPTHCRLGFLVCSHFSLVSQVCRMSFHVLLFKQSGFKIGNITVVCLEVQRTVPTAVKFLGPLVMLLIGFVKFCGGFKSGSVFGGSTMVADSSDVLTIKQAMQTHATQLVWCAARSHSGTSDSAWV
jgi:hypothetical protein